jgi:hypothetical protein
MRNHKLALDTTSEIYPLLAPWADFSFADFYFFLVVLPFGSEGERRCQVEGKRPGPG